MLNPYTYASAQRSYHYTNQTREIQIVKVLIGQNEVFEKAIFPDNYFNFDVPPNAYLEVHTYAIATAIVSDRILCEQLLES